MKKLKIGNVDMSLRIMANIGAVIVASEVEIVAHKFINARFEEKRVREEVRAEPKEYNVKSIEESPAAYIVAHAGNIIVSTDWFFQEASVMVANKDIEITFANSFKNNARELEHEKHTIQKENCCATRHIAGFDSVVYESSTITATENIRLIVSDKKPIAPGLINTGMIQGNELFTLQATGKAGLNNGFKLFNANFFFKTRAETKFAPVSSAVDLQQFFIPGEYEHVGGNSCYYYTHPFYHEKLAFKEIQQVAIVGKPDKQDMPFLMSPLIEGMSVDFALHEHAGRIRIPGFKDRNEQLNGLQNQGFNYAVVHGELASVPGAATPTPYFTICTAANDGYYAGIVNLIGCLHRENYNEIKEIIVFDLGLSKEQIDKLKTMGKVVVREIEKENPNILKIFDVGKTGDKILGWYAWKAVAIKQALDTSPYVLWLDWHMSVCKSLNDLFKHIIQNGYFLSTIGDEKQADGSWMHPVKWGTTEFVKKAFNLDSQENKWILDKELIMNSVIGMARDSEAYKKILMPIYEKAKEKELRYFQDDGTAPNGFGCARWDEPLLCFLAYSQKFDVAIQDYQQNTPIKLKVDGKEVDFHMTWNSKYVDQKTSIHD